ncbi:MAG: Spy/CpxP family protein refolding chaperone [Psychrosphaera sp.]|nr:Spy/CpxP family protein refolding chaperone [Psychrosphaera sp.]
MKKIVSVLGLGFALTFGGAALAEGHDGFERGQDSDGHGGKGHMMKRMFSKLDLTDEQQTSIEALRDQMHDSMEALRGEEGERKAFHEQMKSLVQSEEFDEDAFREMTAAKQVKKTEAAVIKATMKHGVWNVLTAEQQEQMTAMMETKRERRGGKRGERGMHRDGGGA